VERAVQGNMIVQPRSYVDFTVPHSASHLIEIRISLMYITAQNYSVESLLVDRTSVAENIRSFILVLCVI
jgi:hypothetical protein